MTKIIKFVIGIFALILVGSAAVFAFGYGQGVSPMNQANSTHEKGTFHKQVEAVLENGTYEDLVVLREELGFQVMRRVQSQDDFAIMQQRHEEMENSGIEPGYLRNSGSGMDKGQGRMGGNGNCMFQN